jgi:hypothetical protein
VDFQERPIRLCHVVTSLSLLQVCFHFVVSSSKITFPCAPEAGSHSCFKIYLYIRQMYAHLGKGATQPLIFFFFSFFGFPSPPLPLALGLIPAPPIIPCNAAISGIPPIPGAPPVFCISAIMSFKKFSLTPPPVKPGE